MSEDLLSFPSYLYDIGFLSLSDIPTINNHSTNDILKSLVGFLTLKRADELYDMTERMFYIWKDRKIAKG